jgi:serine/threonine protein kinase
MSTDPSTPENDANLSGLGRALMGTNEGSKPSGPWVLPTAEELHAILPQYEIVKMLGRGGMGAVYMGRQTALDRPVAIKILSAQLEESDMGFTERFKNEAKAMAKLNHPGIVAVYDFGEAPGGLLYIVMEYVDGTDVAKMIAKSGRLHTEHAMAITAHVCDALAYAHERGIIHRDIKPANIMVDYDGSVKIADFGLAKVNAGGQTLGLTQSGMAMGTLHFMAPEALMLGSSVDHRADIYAVGVMLYQMLTGKLPQGMFKMPSLLVAGLDPRYDGIIAKGIMEDREARYQSAREMRSDLDGIMTQPVVKADPEVAQIPQAVLPTQARPQRPGGKPVIRQSAAPSMSEPAPRSSQSWLWMSALGLLALGGAAWWMIQPRGQTMPPAAAESADSAKSAHEAQTIAASATTTNPAEATKERPFVNSLGMKFVPVPGTNVLFCIHETRYRDYAVYASGRANIDGSWQDQVTDGIAIKERGDDHPVTQVNWNDAQAFCVWLSNKESKSYRLPTDEEWSHAVGVGNKETRGANITPYSLSRKVPDEYPWGSQWPLLGKSGNYADQSLIAQGLSVKGLHLDGYDDGFPTTSPVMSFPPNSYGLYDLGGNVWEWCEDWHNDSKIDRVIRGASWLWGESGFLLSSHRGHIGQGNRFQDRGFRVVLATESAGPSASAAIQPSATQEPQSGWTSLFNGKDLTGWRVIGSPQGFTVDQGSIKTGGVRADLIYMGTGAAPASFRDFELRMKVKTGSQGNSGLWFHLPPGIQSTKDCDQSLQVQIDNSFNEQRTGSVVHVLSVSQSAVKDGEWFELRVLVQDKTVTALVDGQQVNQWTQPENWNPPAKAALARMGTGTIGLESWKGNVWFQDIQLRSLKDSKPSAGPDEKLILGRWIRTNMDRSGDAYLMDLSPDGSALWTGDNTTVSGTWQFKADVLEVDWNSRFKFLITPPAATSSAILKGTANWPDGKSTEIVYERQAASPSGQAPSSFTTWTDTNGRSLQAKFVRIEGASVLLDIAGKATPIALATLSPSSQQIAQELARASTSADELETLKQSMLGLWRQYNNDSKTFYHVVLLADGRAGWSEYPKSMEFAGKWSVDKQQMVVTFPTGSRYELDVFKVASRVYTGTGTGGRLPFFNLKLVHTGFEPSGSSPASEDLANLNFDFTYIDGGKTGTNGLIQLRPDGSVIQPAPESYQKFAARVVEWRIENGYLMLIEADKRCMALFNEFEKKNGKWHLSGQSLQAAAVRHQLVQE